MTCRMISNILKYVELSPRKRGVEKLAQFFSKCDENLQITILKSLCKPQAR